MKVEKVEYIDVELDLDQDIIDWLEKTAKERGVTPSDIVNEVLEEYLNQHEAGDRLFGDDIY